MTTIAELYAQTVQEIAELEAVHSRLLGKADALSDLIAGGLGATTLPAAPASPNGAASPQEAPEDPTDAEALAAF